MGRPKVSVIVPVYNTEKYLRKCLDSLVNQTLYEVEIVVVNDGSTDGSEVILEEYEKKYSDKFKLMHKGNGGQASARNLALRLCTGEYIGFLDSDDFVNLDMFEKMYNAASTQNADYVACGYKDITYEEDAEIVLKEYVASKVANTTRDLFVGALVSPFLHLYKREVFEESGVVFPEGYIYEDTAFYLNLIPYIKSVVTLEESLAVRVRHSNSTMSTFKKERVRHIMPVIQYALDFYKEKGHYDTYRNELEYFCVKVLLCSSLERVCRLHKRSDSMDLAKETLQFISQNFGEYRKNPYFKSGVTNWYIKSVNAVTIRLYVLIFRVLNKFKRVYS